MNTLLYLESELASLKKKLTLCFNQRIKAFLIFEFLEKLTSKPINPEPYLLETLPLLETSLSNIEIKYIRLDLIKDWLDAIGKTKEKILNPYLVEISNSIHKKLTEKLEEQIKLIEAKFQKAKERKNSFASIFETILKSQSSVNIPFVEYEPLLSNEESILGTVKKLKVIVTRISKTAAADEIDIQMLSQKEKKQVYIELIESAKKIFTEITGTKITDKLSFHCSIEQHNLISGNSLEAGLAAAIFTALYKLYDVRISFDFPSTHAISGGLDDYGNLTPLDEDGLKRKIEACAYSEITNLLVPKKQEEFARQYLSELENQQEREKLLEIIGITNIREVYYDRRNLNQSIASFSQRSIKSIWNRRRPIAAALFTLMALFIAKVVYGPVDKHPDEIGYSGKYLNVKNSIGETITSIEIGEENVKVANSMKSRNINFAGLTDADSDGYKDVIYLEHDKTSNAYGSIVCRSVQLNKQLWVFPLRKKINMPESPVSGEQFSFRQLEVGDIDYDRKAEVYVLCLSNDDPSLVYKLDAQNGKEIGSYLHIGNLQQMKILDLDNDGKSEILLCGINQAYESACLVVLDPNKIYGHGPTKGRFAVESVKEADEKKYILMPKTICGKSDPVSAYNSATDISLDPESTTIKISLTDTNTAISDSTKLNYIILFNYSLEPLLAKPGDHYKKLALNLYDEGTIKTYPDQDYFQQYMKTIVRLK